MTTRQPVGAEAIRSLRPVSMTDVAVHAGVSQKTVSRVVNDEPHVAPELRSRVLASIAELRFRPNAAARALVSQRSRRVGMVTIGTSLFGPITIVEGVEDAARARGYSLSVVRTDDRGTESMQLAIDLLVAQGVEAIVISEPVDLGDVPIRIPEGVGVLTIGSDFFTTLPTELTCGVDEVGGARSATDHLLSLGHETVWHVAGPSNWFATHRRLEGWRAALVDAEAPQFPVSDGDWSPQSGFNAMREILHRDEATAVFAANDQMAIGAIAAVEATGLRVPADVSVVGFDDVAHAAFLSVPLTTVRQDLAEATRVGMHRLFSLLEGHPPRERQRIVPVQLVNRATTAAPNPRRRRVHPV